MKSENKQRQNIPRSPGRPKGSPNKMTALLKDAVLQAADQAGGKDGLVGYLRTQATKNPGPFLSLLGKVLPTQLTGSNDDPIQHCIKIRFVPGPNQTGLENDGSNNSPLS
jgi:hypothetical protein